MPGAVIEVRLDAEYAHILAALEKASRPNMKRIADAAGLELENVTAEAFEKREDPSTGTPWKAKWDGTAATLHRRGTLAASIHSIGYSDGATMIGSNLVYSRIQQEGGQTRPHAIKAKHAKALAFWGSNGMVFRKSVHHLGSKIPARPFLGIPRDFERDFFDDPVIQEALGLASGGES